MNTVKIQHIFLNFCCKLPLILGILTQVFLSFLNLSINYYSNPALALNCSLFSNLFFLFLLIFLLSLPFIVFFIYGFKCIFFLISVIAILFSINTASAGKIIIASDTNQKVVPFSQLIEASLNQEFQKYNAYFSEQEFFNHLENRRALNLQVAEDNKFKTKFLICVVDANLIDYFDPKK